MLYQISSGTVSVGGELIPFHIDFEIRGNEKIAVVDKNGAGKIILLKLVAGEPSLDRDDRREGTGIRCSRQLTVGMLSQQAFKDGSGIVGEKPLETHPCQDTSEREHFECERKYDTPLTGFGFPRENKRKRISQFSGGEQTKIALIRLLLEKPDILFLDEPTNYLNMEIARWLEQYIRHYKNAVVMVSHSRSFLDQTADIIYGLSEKVLRRYPGNHTHYREEKLKQTRLQKKTYEHQQKELARLEGLVECFKHKPSKASLARAKRKTVEHMERAEKPQEDDVHILTGEINPLLPGSRWVLVSEHLKIGYERPLFEIIICIRRGQKIAPLGPDGTGKTMLLKAITGFLLPLEGSYSLGNQTTTGYSDQHSGVIQSRQIVLEHLVIQFPALTEKEARSILGIYLFGGRNTQKKISSLSGGEKVRLALAELLQSRPDFLILDEPTDHMDIRAGETLESASCAYKGTILFVFHDRCFIRQVADAVMISEYQLVMCYLFRYGHYLERKAGGNQNGSMATQIETEEQALIASMRAMPKAERHRLRGISEDEAYREWNIYLAAEHLEPIGSAVKYLTGQVRELKAMWQGSEVYWNDGVWDRMDECGNQCLHLRQAWEGWRRTCMEWPDKAQEMEALQSGVIQ